MPNPIVHFEIAAKEPTALAAFYGAVFGWTTEQFPIPGGHTYLGADTHAGGINGGIMQAPEGVLPMVTCYVAVDDLEATLARVQAAGGQTIVPVTDVGMVVFAMFTDPQGHAVGLVKGDGSMPEGHEHKEPTDGAVTWFEVVGSDGVKLIDFYQSVFGWEIQRVPGDMVYGMADTKAGGIGAGIGQAPMDHTTFYIQASDLDATLKKIEAAGGKTVMPPQDMGMVVFAMFSDPDGCLVGLVKG